MQLQIRTNGVHLTEQLRRFACEKIDMALHRIHHRVTKITLNFFDANGPDRGGADQACRVIVQLQKQEAIILQDVASNLGEVIDRISDRLSMAAGRRVDRARTKRNLRSRRWPIPQIPEA